MSFVKQNWFLFALSILIITGMTTGYSAPDEATPLVSNVPLGWVVALILFLMSFTLDSGQLWASFQSPGPVLLACFVNLGIAPSLGWILMPIQGNDDFRYGLLVASCVPCTMAAASVWTRRAMGNDAVSLLTTLVTNFASIGLVPLWLMAGSFWGGSSNSLAGELLAQGREFIDSNKLIRELGTGVIVPLFLGQLSRAVPVLRSFAQVYKIPCSMAAQCLVLVTVLVASVKAGGNLASSALTISIGSILLVWGCCIAIHLVALYGGWGLARWFRFRLADQVAIAFAGSQKTLPVGLLVGEKLATEAGLSFAFFPMLMYHASQLFIDTIIAERMARLGKAESPDRVSQ